MIKHIYVGQEKNKANGNDGLCPEGMNKNENLRLQKENKIIWGWWK